MSMFVDSRGIQRWTCFATGARGTAIDLVVVAHGRTVGEAIEFLASRCSLRHTPADRATPAPRPLPAPLPRRPPSPALEAYVADCERLLWTPTGQAALDWLTNERGFTEAALRANRVGADPGPRRLDRARGLPRGGSAAVFPVLDDRRRAVYLQARYLTPAEGRSRFDNPAGDLAQNPRTAYVRADRPREAALRYVLVTEGLTDGLAAASAGWECWAVLGAGYPDARVADAVAEDVRVPVIAFDGDAAGRAGTDRLVDLLRDRGTQPAVLRLTSGDLADRLRANPESFADRLSGAIDLATTRPPPSREACGRTIA
jgi:DNA primase